MNSRESTKANTKKAVAERFLDLFTLTPTELALLSAPLTFTARDSNPPFFDVLDRLRSVSENTRALLTTEHQTAGTEIMQLLSSYQERAFDRLHKWTSAECRTLARDAADAAPALRRAFRALRSRPLLFRSAIDDAVNVRRQAVARQFVDALTRGGPGGTPRPIELHAHDPVRYIGDMLAWLHQASAGERELLEQMFSDRSEEDIVPDEIEAGTVEELMDRATEGTTRPLRMRVEQVLSSHPPPVVAYKIANILQFYRFTVGKILGDNAQLTRVLDELLATAERVFFDVINMQASRMVRMGVKMEGLAVPAQIKEAVGQLVRSSWFSIPVLAH